MNTTANSPAAAASRRLLNRAQALQQSTGLRFDPAWQLAQQLAPALAVSAGMARGTLLNRAGSAATAPQLSALVEREALRQPHRARGIESSWNTVSARLHQLHGRGALRNRGAIGGPARQEMVDEVWSDALRAEPSAREHYRKSLLTHGPPPLRLTSDGLDINGLVEQLRKAMARGATFEQAWDEFRETDPLNFAVLVLKHEKHGAHGSTPAAARLFNREYVSQGDGWYLIEPFGDHPNRAVVQVIDAAAARVIADTFNREAAAGGLRHGRELLIDHEHFSSQLDKETIAYGWLQQLEARGDGLYGRVHWTATGRSAIEGGDYRFFSTEYDQPDMIPVPGRAGHARPVRLAGLTLTNMPNNRGQRPISIPREALAA